MYVAKLVSSLEKIFPDDNIVAFPELKRLTVLKNERFSFQLAYHFVAEVGRRRGACYPMLSGVPAECVTMRTVQCIPSTMPVYADALDNGYLRTSPGLFPDLLQPLHNHDSVPAMAGQSGSIWITVDPQGGMDAGVHTLTLTLKDAAENEISLALEVTVLDAELPEQDLIVTQWFHCDCLSSYYDVPVFSERHWEIIEAFVRTAVKNGQTMLLTPTITPAFDTEIGGERPTVQLVDITVTNGVYSYSYDKLDRFVEMAKRCGIRYFEIPPLFTQWGAAHAPKVMATVDGQYRRIFGWETDAASEEYAAFLVSFMRALIEHLKALGIDKQCYFHMSDEPNMAQLEQYKASQAGIRAVLRGHHTMDALSNIEFYKQGLIDTPIPAINHIEPFLEANIPGLWCYYCCGQNREVSNRFFSLPSARNRILGAQIFKYNIAGFLHWGYNFYYNMHSINLINPYFETTGEAWVPSGDAFVVYPGPEGQPLESLRLVVFHEALQDLRAMQLCEQFYGHDAVVEALERVGGEIRFDRCPTRAGDMLALRDCVNEMIARALEEKK